ncbi:hypothetical protein TNCV_1145061 [Trichonephila clavipes]|nr:hypothetical protein TNCV_1145061 [Trichonephila clavipes]
MSYSEIAYHIVLIDELDWDDQRRVEDACSSVLTWCIGKNACDHAGQGTVVRALGNLSAAKLLVDEKEP